MDIRLVTTSFNDEVHGTFNDKKTGCGINLTKSENATRYRRGAVMTDLGEITCEKCKTKIAKEMIKSDQKEMKALLKEEKARAKKGIEDEGIVPLGNTTAKITGQQPEPEPEPVAAAEPPKAAPAPEKPVHNIPGTGVAIDDDLAKFAINVPKAEEPAPVEEKQEDDFLAQFAIQKPQEEEAPAEEKPEEDFLAQFAIPTPAHEEPVQPADPEPEPEPAAPPVIDDISAALAAMQQNAPAPVQHAEPEPVPEPAPAVSEPDDILSMFSIGAPDDSGIEVLSETKPDETSKYDNDTSVIDVADESLSAVESTPEPEAPAYEPVEEQEIESSSEWDVIANQLFGAPAPEPEAPAPAEAKPAADVIEAAPTEMDELPAIEDIAVPLLSEPVIEDISAAEKLPEAEEISAPVLEDISVPEIEDISVPDQPVIEDISAAEEPDTIPAPEPVQEAAPIIDDISAALAAAQQNAPIPAAPVIEEAPKPVEAPAPEPVQEAAPVIDDISAALAAVQQNAPIPAAPVQQPAPQPTAPVQNAAAAPAQGTAPQIISVPQITGYDSANQPVYTYVQMQITGYDGNGQPILAPLPGQEIPAFTAPFNKNTRLQDAVKAAQEIPTSYREMTPGQRIAAAEAAKNAPVSANVSKIATNPHARSTSQAFINAISESKEYANQSLTDTQGLQQRTQVIGSIEDVLSQLGDNSLKQKKLSEAQAQKNIPTFEEYKAPGRTAQKKPASSPAKPAAAPVENRPLTKAELKAKKKQEKIDAKFKKEMAKRGL